MDRVPDGVQRVNVQQELPRGMERRLVLRLLHHWRDMCGERVYPSFADVDPAAIADMWPHCFVLETIEFEDDPVFRFLGEEIAAHASVDLVGRRCSDVRDASILQATLEDVPRVLRKRVPISHGGEFFRADGAKVLYRSIVLPMSDDGETISGLLCAANCRTVPDT